MRMGWVVVLALGLGGCAMRYLRITAGSMLDCPQDKLKIHQRKDDPIWYRVEGCGRTVHCQEMVWVGTDEWECSNQPPDR